MKLVFGHYEVHAGLARYLIVVDLVTENKKQSSQVESGVERRRLQAKEKKMITLLTF